MVWVKDSFVLGHSEYHYQHEPILFGWTEGTKKKNDNRKRTSVWSYDRPKRSEDHPTMKPVKMWAQMILDATEPGQIVYDPFCGSGTTVVACEQMSRKSFAIEISPQYVDVIVKRWENMTGKKAGKLDG
jgi:DNA modification methylase